MNPASSPDSPDSGGAAPPKHVMTAEERAEYERLRRHAAVRHRRVRQVGASVLLLLTLLLAPLAVVAAWVQDTVSDTDRYVQTVAPNGAGTTAGMLGYMFWAAERPSTRGIGTVPPNTCLGGVGAGATALSVPVPMPALRQS